MGLVQSDGAATPLALNGEKVASAGVAGRVTQLAHRARFDLTNALACEVEVFAHFEGALARTSARGAGEPSAELSEMEIPIAGESEAGMGSGESGVGADKMVP